MAAKFSKQAQLEINDDYVTTELPKTEPYSLTTEQISDSTTNDWLQADLVYILRNQT